MRDLSDSLRLIDQRFFAETATLEEKRQGLLTLVSMLDLQLANLDDGPSHYKSIGTLFRSLDALYHGKTDTILVPSPFKKGKSVHDNATRDLMLSAHKVLQCGGYGIAEAYREVAKLATEAGFVGHIFDHGLPALTESTIKSWRLEALTSGNDPDFETNRQIVVNKLAELHGPSPTKSEAQKFAEDLIGEMGKRLARPKNRTLRRAARKPSTDG